jgi:[ribosomal protein S18]-alanine N-acetyltransferase
MTDNITIRRGTPADLDSVIAIANGSASAAHWSKSEFDAIFSSGRLLLLAESQMTMIGFLVAHCVAGEWGLENVVVAASHQRRGIGERLVHELISTAKNGSAAFIFLEVRESNVAAKSLYERCGFQRSGRRKEYYSNPPEDAILYRFLCTPAALENC